MPAEWENALMGGVLIGLGASMLLLANGRVSGISGIFCGALMPKPREIGWRLAFLAGLLAGGLLFLVRSRELFADDSGRSPFAVGIAGLLVGFGTRLGGGCTSGHGVCGISRFGMRSVLATITFILAGALTVFILSRGGGA